MAFDVMKLAWLLLPLVVLSGCAMKSTPYSTDDDGASQDDLSDDPAPAPKKKSSTTTTPPPPAATTPPAPEAPAAPDVTYGVTVPATDPVPFGGVTPDGKQVCGLQNFQNLSIVVVANSKGEVKSFTLKATNIEQANPACPNVTAAPQNDHVYTFTNNAPTDAPARLVPAAANQPQADLVADVAVHADAGGRTTIHFQSTAWQYTLQFQLTKQ